MILVVDFLIENILNLDIDYDYIKIDGSLIKK